MVRALISRTTNAVLIDTSSDIMNLNYCLDNEDFSPGEMMSQELEAGRLPRGLTWTFLDTKCAVGVLGSGVVLQLERGGVVHKRLRALGHARPAVVEIGARLRRKHTTPVRSRQQADRHTPEEVSFSHNIGHQGVSFQ